MSELKRLEHLLSLGKINRREFMMRASALGLAAAVPGMMSTRAEAAMPKQGGHFKLGIGAGSTTDSLDPATYLDVYMQTVGHGLHSYLMEVDNKSEAIEALAESVEPSPDAKVWTVKLKKGVEFHNGKSMEAEDVIASYNHHRGKDSKSAAKGVVDPIEDIKADGKDTVVFTLNGGNADFPYVLSDYHLAIMPSKDGKVDATSGIGAGALKLKSFEPGVTTQLERNANYWKDGRGHFDSAEVLAIKDVTARTNALNTGQIHAMDRCDLKTVHLLKRNNKLEVTQVTGTQHYTMPMFVDVAPFDDVNVRMALKLAVDRKELVEKILRGFGAVGNDDPISSTQKFFNKDMPQREYDPDEAKSYLKKAGLSSLKVNLSAADAAFAGAVDAAVLYKEQAAKAGIDINVVREPDDGYWSNVWLKKPFCMCYWGGRPTADWMFSIAYAADASWNDTHWKNKRFNELLVKARAELDQAKRRQMYYEMQTLVRDDGGTIVPMFASYVAAMSTQVGHDKLASDFSLDGLRCLERWWLKA
jgi:peptide/nickel transport system substrate-binding protein